MTVSVVGSWHESSPPSRPLRRATCVDGQLTIRESKRVLACVRIEQSQVECYFSADQRFVWLLGVEDGRASVRLYDESLRCVDEYHPLRPSYYHESSGEYALEDWGEDTMVVAAAEPDVLLVYANGGDDPCVLLTLCATPSGIEDPCGVRLLETARATLDARVWGASFASADRFLLLGDVNDLSLFSWPQLEKVASTNLELESLAGAVKFTSDSMVDECMAVVGDHLLVAVRGKHAVEGLVVLDPATLDVRGVTPPPTRASQFAHIDDGVFVAMGTKGRSYWTWSG